jgi:flagellin
MLQRMNELAVQASNDTNMTKDRKYIQTEIDQLATEISRVANTTTFNEQSLLNGYFNGKKLQVGSESDDTKQIITVSISGMSATSLNVNALKVTTHSLAGNAISSVKDALNKVSEQRSNLGAIQNRLEHTIKNLDNVVENTTAAESQIRDTDMASEMVKYSNNNILMQAGQSMLAQANQSNQGVLSLLG